MRGIPGVRGLLPAMPASVWGALGADAFSGVGTGLTVPFLMVYLHVVRGLSLGVAGAAFATLALAGVVGNPLGGAWADRIGPRPVLGLGWAVAGVGACGIAVVSRPWQALVAAGIAGLGAALAWPALDTLLGRLVPEQKRSGAFALRHATLNASLALGGLTAAMIAHVGRPSSFVLLYVLDAVSFLLAIPLLWLIRVPALASVIPRQPHSAAAPPPGSPAGGYRTVVRDRLFVRLWLLIAILVAVGFAQFSSAFPVYVVSAGQSAAVVGAAFAVNAVTVIVCQLPVLRLARGRRRTAAVVALSALWAAAWALVLAGSHLGDGLAVPLFVLAAVAFGLGETLFAPSVPAMVNDIAPEALRGRYNGGSAFAYTVGFALGPASAGLLLEHRLGSQLLAGLIAGCGAAALLAMSARRRIPATANIIDPPAPGSSNGKSPDGGPPSAASAPPLPDHREILA